MKLLPTNKLKTQAGKVLVITAGWVVLSIFQFFNGYTTLRSLNCDLTGLNPFVYLKGSILTGIMAGILGGSLMVFLWERLLRVKNYGIALIHIFWTYTILYCMILVSTSLFVESANVGMTIFDQEVWTATFEKFTRIDILQSYLFWLFIVLCTLIILQVNDKYGPGVFGAFLLGKYFHPKREERIFMFLDIRSSTTIAEKLGEQRYFNFLNDFFRHVTPAILHASGEIYQYVGDEIVVSWKVDKGKENINCLNCFFDIQKAIHRQTAYYEQTYGLRPEFKAGLHFGHVMAGEIGVVKRDIAYSGDVLNTASRIQSKCNELGVDILLSKLLVDKLGLPAFSFQPQEMGDMLLRGKSQKVMLFTV